MPTGLIKIEDALQFAEWYAGEDYGSHDLNNINRLCDRHGCWPLFIEDVYKWWRNQSPKPEKP